MITSVKATSTRKRIRTIAGTEIYFIVFLKRAICQPNAVSNIRRRKAGEPDHLRYKIAQGINFAHIVRNWRGARLHVPFRHN